jgi:hypothetical protein
MANGLFLTPEEALAAERQARAGLAMKGGATSLGAAGQELGRSLGGAISRGFGASVPESADVQMARARAEVVKGLNPTDISSFLEGAKSLYESGDSQGAVSLIAQAKSLQGMQGKREILKDAEGFNRYIDTGERVFPDATKPDEEDSFQSRTFLMNDGTYKAGFFSPGTGRRFIMEGGQRVEAPEDAFDVTYRVDKQPKLSLPDIKELGKRSATVDKYVDLTNSFQDDFGGYKFEFAGDIVNVSKKIFGDESGQAIWWQSHDTLKNELRHELFGSALTQTEAKNFDKITVHPGQHPDVIRENLSKQMNIAKSAAMKLINAQRAKGIPDSQVKAAVGPVAWSFVDDAAPAKKRLKYNPQTGRLE